MRIIFLISIVLTSTILNCQDYFSNRLFVKIKEEYKTTHVLEKDKRLSILLSPAELVSAKPISGHPLLNSTYELILDKDINLDSLILRLNQIPEIEFAEKVPLYKLFFTPNDPLYSTQWNLSKIQADLAWNLSQGCANVKVAVTDDGFLMTHEDLVNQWHINTGEIAGNGIDDDGNGYIDDWRGWDAANNDNDPSATSPTNTYFTHGTHVAGIIAGQTHNSKGIAAIGYNCKMIPVKIGLSSNSFLTGAFQGLDYAVNASGCDVINMSWGGGGWSATYQTLFNIAKTKGIICVAAAGNSNTSTPMYPASYNHVISVAASASTDARASFSNFGSTIDVTAPGVGIPSCLAGATNSYGNLSGTSMASPLVAGLCALMKCYNPMPADSIEACLKRTCDNINAQNPSFIGQLGAGRINAFQALQCLTKKPKSDFTALDTFQCTGKSIRYTARSFGIPTLSYYWSFPGGSPASSTAANPVVSYTTNGYKTATLITCNSLGCDTITKTNLVNIDTPKASLIGRKYTSYNSNPVLITIKFTGNPPYSVTLTDGTNTWTQSNVKTNPYFLSIVPKKDTSLISISAFSDSLCVGNRYGVDTIHRTNLGKDTTICVVLKTSNSGAADLMISYNTNSPSTYIWSDVAGEFTTERWTTSGTPTSTDGILNFNLNSIPSNAIVNSATISLYSNNSVANWAGQPTAGTNNTAKLSRVTSSWSAPTFPSTFPSFSTSNQVNLAQTPTANSNHLNLDAKNLIQDIISNGNNGILFHLNTASFYNCLQMHSWQSSDTSKHPKLVLCYTIPGGGSSSGGTLCRDSAEINSAQTGWQALQTNGSWSGLSASNYCAGAFTPNASVFPGMTTSDCIWGPTIETGNRTAYNSASWTTTSVYSCSFVKLKKSFSLPSSSIIDSVRLWMVSDDFIDSVWVNNKLVFKAINPLQYGQILILGNETNIGNSILPLNEVIVKSGDAGGCYGTYFRMKVYYRKVCGNISDCDTTNLNTGKVLHLDFNGNTQDKSGNGNHATNYGTIPVAGKSGVANTAYRFDGVNDYMQIANSTSLNNFSGNKITMTAILKPRGFYNGTCKGNSIIMKGNTDYQNGNYLLRYSPNNGCNASADTNQNNFYGSISSSGGCSLSQIHNPPYVKRDSWYCVVVVYTGDSIHTYINGEKKYSCSYSGSIGSHSMDVFIGKLDNATYPYWLNADIDDIRIYNRVLAHSEVKGYCGTCNTEPVCKMVNTSACWLKDAIVASNFPNNNHGNHPEYLGTSWTCNGSPCQARSYFDFNLSQIPTNAIIDSVKLYLKALPAGTAGNGYSGTPTFGTNNACVIRRVTQSWSENSVTWNNKPATTTTNEVTLLQSTNTLQNYTVNMKQLIIDYIANPTSSFGFELKHIAEGTSYNSMIFGSSDHSIDSLRPKLEICYHVPSGNPIYSPPPSECDSTYGCDTTNLNTGKVLLLDFNGNTQDKSGLGNHATNYGATLTSDRKGNANAAYNFNGSTSRMVIPNFPTSSSNNISISVWFKSGASSQQAYAGLLDHSHTTGTLKNWTIEHSNTNSAIFFDWRNSSSNWANTINDPVSYDHNKWNHLVVVKKTDTLQYYLNCTLVFEKKYTGMANIHKFVADLNIGFVQSNSGPFRYYNGSIDELSIYHRVLTLGEIKALGECCSTSPPPSDCDTSGLVLCMSMDGNANDSAKFAHNGIVRGATLTTGRNGISNSAYYFDGTTSHISLGVKPMLKPNAASISVWVKPHVFNSYTAGNANCIFLTKNPNNPGSYMEAYSLYLTNRSGPTKFMTVSTHQPTTNEKWFQSNQNTALNQWTHLVLTFDNDSLKLYINGQLDNKVYKGFTNVYDALDSIMLGYSANTTNKNYFKGDMDELKMYNRVLSTSEVSNLYIKPFSCSCNSIQLPPCDTAQKFTYTQCLNDSIQVLASAGSKYQWSPVSGLSNDTIRNPKVFVSNNQRYLVSYASAKNCQLIDTIDIEVKAAAIYPKMDDQLICIGDSVQMTIPIHATNILWSPNTAISSTSSKNPFFFPTTPTTYYLEFSDTSGCLHRDTFVVNTKVCCPARARFTIPKDQLCFGETIAVTNTSKGPITSYNWNFSTAIPNTFTGANPPILTFPSGGSYTLKLIVTNGTCSDTMIKTVNVVHIIPYAGLDTTNCLGAFVTDLGELPISDWTYKWTPTKYLDDPNIANPKCSIVNDSVNYILEITDRSSECKASDTVVVYTNRKIDSTVQNLRICDGDSVLFNGIQRKTSGNYFYTIKKADGICDSFINLLRLNVLQKQFLNYTPKIHCDFYIDGKGKRHDTSYIERDTIRSKSLLNCDSIINITPREIFKKIYIEKTVQGCSPFRYNGKTYLTSKTKVDSIRIRGAYSGCDSIIEYINVIVYPKPKAEITPSIPNPVLYKQTVTLTASGGQTYLWLQMGSTNSEIDYKLNQIQPRLFTVRVTDDNNCWDTVSYIVNGELPDTCNYGFPNAFTPNQDGLNDEYMPNMDECTEIKVFAIYDRWGEKVFETNQQKGWNGFYKGKPAPPSVYLYYAELITPWGIKIHKGNFTLIR